MFCAVVCSKYYDGVGAFGAFMYVCLVTAVQCLVYYECQPLICEV